MANTVMMVTVIYICNTGDTVDVVVPPLAESISDGTLANFLKSMLILIFFYSIYFNCFFKNYW